MDIAFSLLLLVSTLVIGIAIGIALRARKSSFSSGLTDLQPSNSRLLPDLQRKGLLTRSTLRPVRRGDSIVLINPGDSDEVMIFGSEVVGSEYGEVIGRIPAQLATVAVGANALAKAGIDLSEQAGILVRLTPESSLRMAQLGKTVDSSGNTLGVLRGSNGRIDHIIRFRPASGAQALVGVTGMLAAVAMQAQMAEIARAIGHLTEAVAGIQESLDIQFASRIHGTSEILEEVFQSANAHGRLTQASWDQIASIGAEVFINRKESEQILDALLCRAASKKSTGDRRKWLRENQSRLVTALTNLELAEQCVLQYASLRLWWLISVNDPTLDHHVQDLKQKISTRQVRKSVAHSATRTTLNAVGEVTWFDWTHSPIDTKAVRSGIRRLIGDLQDRGLLSETQIELLAPSDQSPTQSSALTHTADTDHKETEARGTAWPSGHH